MALNLAPYHTAMRIGQGFNSYTHEIMMNDAVVFDEAAAGGDHYQSDTKQVSQIVTYCTRHVDKLSDITDAMNVSAALSIKTATAGGGLAGSFVDANKFKESSINFFVQVRVVNQTIMAEDVTKFNAIKGVSDTSKFMKVYGDSFISGFIEGGELDALVSIKVTDSSSVRDIKASLEAHFGQGAAAGGSLNASLGIDKQKTVQNSETTITVNWNGGGDIKEPHELWSIESLTRVAAAFPNNVARCPQRTHAIITKYDSLRSFQLEQPKPSVLDYDIASLYTNDLLDSMMSYKNIWKKLHVDASDFELGLVTLQKAVPPRAKPPRRDNNGNGNGNGSGHGRRGERRHFIEDVVQTARDHSDDSVDRVLELVKLLHSPAGSHSSQGSQPQTSQDFDYPDNAGVPYEPDDHGLEKARKDCRLEMIKIVKEVDAVIENPSLALDNSRDAGFLNPSIFRKLLPIVTPVPAQKPPTSSAPGLLARGSLYNEPGSLPSALRQHHDEAQRDGKATHFVMAGWAGDHGTHQPPKTFFDLTQGGLTTKHVVKKIEMWNHTQEKNEYMVGYRLTFRNGSTAVVRMSDKGVAPTEEKGAAPAQSHHVFEVEDNDRIVSVQMTAGLFSEFPVLLISSIKVVTAAGKSKVLGHTLPSNSVTLWTEAPAGNYSLKGFWGQSGSSFDRLGVFYGLDE
ncbi:uncharacterized protein UV8b_03395 [Ustilaginoidea virens]|uniref:Jacalin-type lectin domain-containing protein n=1 Tax=Ustilaginoidea virens TaxID=1159556 RepID=A0A063BTG4_USTVR|nr:uncharacterized protein UV8b_03395 [Ustilaginoidea virens]QUC19154.1 hypothetical protein UV8b_03395 [Ustilaginoidea virens]GAO18648.1 hypothetical protein UVI_02058600 [Ustilaginoidea virens]